MSGTNHDHADTARKTYNDVGERYDAQTGPFKRAIAYPELIRLLMEGLDASLSGKRVLDIGCGSGELVEMLTLQGALATGIDVADERIKSGCSLGRSLACASMLDIPFPDASFDATVSFHAFNYAPYEDQRRVLAEQYRVLKEGGFLVLASFPTEEKNGPVTIRQLDTEFTLYPTPTGDIDFLLRDCGFFCITHRLVSCTELELAAVLTNVDAKDAETLARLVTGSPYAAIALATRL